MKRSIRRTDLFTGRFKLLCEGIRKYKFIKFFTIGIQYFMLAAFPAFQTLVDKDDLLADLHYRVHVVRIYNSCHGKLLGQLLDQSINKYSSKRIETGIWLITEKIFRIQ